MGLEFSVCGMMWTTLWTSTQVLAVLLWYNVDTFVDKHTSACCVTVVYCGHLCGQAHKCLLCYCGIMWTPLGKSTQVFAVLLYRGRK